jgi:hypothetical protein
MERKIVVCYLLLHYWFNFWLKSLYSTNLGKGVVGLLVISNPNTIFKQMSIIFNRNNWTER